MTLKRKLVLVFDLVLVLAVLQAGTVVILLAQVAEQSALLVHPAIERVDLLAHSEADLLRLRSLELSRLSIGSAAEARRVTTEMDQLRAAVAQRLDHYAAMTLDPARASAGAEVRSRYDAFVDAQRTEGVLVVAGDRDAASAAYVQQQPAFERLDERIHALRHLEYAATEAQRDEIVALANRWRWAVVALALVVALVDLGLGWYLGRSLARSLRILHEGARQLAREDLDAPIARPSEPELGILADALEHSRSELAAARAARARAEAERQRLAREQVGAVVRAQEEERARISRELHDQAAQALTALRYRLGRLKQLAADPAIAEEVDQLVALSADSGRQITQLARDLRPSVLDDLGLVPALRSCAREFSDRMGIHVGLSCNRAVPSLSRDAEMALFRIVQEALTNVAKHAGASEAWVDLDANERRLIVSVRDNGRGFDPASLSRTIAAANGGLSGLGLAGIRERVGLLDGTVEIQSSLGDGTKLTANIPLAAMNLPRKAA